MNIDAGKMTDIEFDGIVHRDYPDYCDAFISSASIEITADEAKNFPQAICVNERYFREMTEAEIEWVQATYPEWVYERLMHYLH